MAVPVVQNLEQILAELEPAYATQRGLYGTQQAGLEQKYAGQIQGMNVRKENSFRDINRGANARGMAFSGAPIEEEMRYVGEQYLPGITGLQSQQNEEGMKLQMALAQLDSEKRLKGVGMRENQQSAYQQYQQEQQRRAWEAEQARIAHQRDMEKTRYTTNASGGGTIDLDIRKNKAGGWDVIENGSISRNYDLATASKALGRDLISLLSQGDKKDKQAAKWYQDNLRLGRGEGYAKQRLLKDRGTAFYRGGFY